MSNFEIKFLKFRGIYHMTLGLCHNNDLVK